jgi:hypothetical protein
MSNEPVEYRVTPSLVTGAMRYTLEADALVVESAKKSDRRPVALSDVAQVRLTCIQGIGRCELHTRRGDKIVILSRHFRGFADFVEQRAEYAHFVAALHARLLVAAPGARYLGGTSFGFAMGVVAVVMGAASALFVLAVIGAGDLAASAKMVAPLAAAVSIGVPLMAAGRAKPYRPDALPEKQMPRA